MPQKNNFDNRLTPAATARHRRSQKGDITFTGDIHHGGIHLRKLQRLDTPLHAMKLGIRASLARKTSYKSSCEALGTGRTHQPASAVEQDAASLPYPAIPFFLLVAALKVMPEPRRCDGGTDTRFPKWIPTCVDERRSAEPGFCRKHGLVSKGLSFRRLTLPWFSGLGFMHALPSWQVCQLNQVPNACRCAAKTCRWRDGFWPASPSPRAALKIPNVFS